MGDEGAKGKLRLYIMLNNILTSILPNLYLK